ncbi:MurR/RpiR family transcriptional regulator [Alkalihalobacillus sp. CinArs1]|uniref:MurR/RpiR family transcriptional regulator n=1 Tax=Alkalihalobacillus sp. CinArs1 TaxID=2995314 RepID=UPI0022DCF223|nr:MurR/RpiR family transcriptional regulator [Alkalihalobacillus sp. CinArs1]
MLSLEERYRKFEFQLTDLEDQIIQYMLEHRRDVVKMSIQKLAKETHTVPNSIMRLMKKLEYEGFTQLKLRLKDEMEETETNPDSFQYEIERTFELTDPKLIEVASEWMHQSQRLLVYGAGALSYISELLVMNIKPFHKDVTFTVHRHQNIAALHHFTKKDLVILLSQSGDTDQTVELAEYAKERGARVLGMSHMGESRLSRVADLMLYCYAPKEEIKGYNTTNFVPMAIVGRKVVEAYRKLCV